MINNACCLIEHWYDFRNDKHTNALAPAVHDIIGNNLISMSYQRIYSYA